jgi:hypothetical protein
MFHRHTVSTIKLPTTYAYGHKPHPENLNLPSSREAQAGRLKLSFSNPQHLAGSRSGARGQICLRHVCVVAALSTTEQPLILFESKSQHGPSSRFTFTSRASPRLLLSTMFCERPMLSAGSSCCTLHASSGQFRLAMPGQSVHAARLSHGKRSGLGTAAAARRSAAVGPSSNAVILEEEVDAIAVLERPGAVPNTHFEQHDQALAQLQQLVAFNSQLGQAIDDAELVLEMTSWNSLTLPVSVPSLLPRLSAAVMFLLCCCCRCLSSGLVPSSWLVVANFHPKFEPASVSSSSCSLTHLPPTACSLVCAFPFCPVLVADGREAGLLGRVQRVPQERAGSRKGAAAPARTNEAAAT